MLGILLPIIGEGMVAGIAAGFGAHALGAPLGATFVAGTVAALSKTLPQNLSTLILGAFGQKPVQTS